METGRDVIPPRVRRPSRGEVRERLIAGAMRAFAERGFAGASIDFICAQAGFSRGAFYSNFEDKEGLFFALYERRTDRLYARIEAIAQAAEAAEDPMQAVARLLREPDADEVRWDILNKEFILHALRNEAARDRLIAARAAGRDRLARILLILKSDLAYDPDRLEELCRFISALHEGELTQIGLEPRRNSGPSLLSQFVPMVLARIP